MQQSETSFMSDRKKKLAQRGETHFILNLNGLSLVYCHIRKNACTSFKSLFYEHSPHKTKLANYPTGIRFLNQNHRVKDVDIITSADESIFVYRDPVKRLVSVFKNKFIQRRNGQELFSRYAEVSGEDPEEASFTDFITNYCVAHIPEGHRIDPHCLPQSDHLLPIEYTRPIAIGDLHAVMTEIVGAPTADRFFAHPTNQSEVKPLDLNGRSAHTMTSQQLYKLYQDTGRAPASSAFVTQELRQIIADSRYRDDVDRFSDRQPAQTAEWI